MFLSLAGKVKGVPHDALDAAAREDRLLHGHFVVRTFVEAAADVGVLAFVVFAHDGEIDLAGLPVFKRGLNAVKEAHGAEIDVLAESAANGDEQAPKRNVIGDAGMPDRAEEGSVERAELLETVGGHHAAGLEVCFAAPIELLPAALETKAASGGFDDTNAFRNDFLTDTVAGNYRDLEGFHRAGPQAFRPNLMTRNAYKGEAYLNVSAQSLDKRKLI